MSSKVLVLFAVLCLLGSCWGAEETTQSLTRHEDIPIEPIGVSSDPDLNKDATFWRFWKFWKWARRHEETTGGLATGRAISSSTRLQSESATSIISHQQSVQKEIVTLLFEAMLPHIVLSWKTIKTYEVNSPVENLGSVVDVSGKKRKYIGTKTSKTKNKSRSKIEDVTSEDKSQISDPMHIIWWSAPDEKAIIRFRNGNVYEGDISMKMMSGRGRFQWNDGTIYIGHFKENEMKGKGRLSWNNDSWYQGDFCGNLRHGQGLYVDSRQQRCYYGDWHWGTKHGQGLIHYDGSFRNSYDGTWIQNVRHGFGTREYNELSGYQGEWDVSVRDGKGLAIWSNHDLYEGDWKNGIMSGFGFYTWDTQFNNSMSMASQQAYLGQWFKGNRDGYGILYFGYNFGSHYKGQFRENKKHGAGKFVSNNGYIVKDKKMFQDDTIVLENVVRESENRRHMVYKVTDGDGGKTLHTLQIPNYQTDPPFILCDSTMGLRYHVEQALKNLDREAEIRAAIINEYIETNTFYGTDCSLSKRPNSLIQIDNVDSKITEDLILFETSELFNAVRCYESDIKRIYYQYATICNESDIYFTPNLMRLYLWQFYYDCNIHEKGLTLVQIDEMFAENPMWLARSLHGPFDKIYLWQFLNGLIALASLLYARKTLPGPRPDTIMAKAFRQFMDEVALPSAGKCKGYLTESFGKFVPLKSLYKVYRTLGEPPTVRMFLCAVRQPPHLVYEKPQPELIDESDEQLQVGRNVFIYGNEMTYVNEERRNTEQVTDTKKPDLLLFNFGNLSSKTIIKIFADIFPQLCEKGIIKDLDISITFFEFFQAFIACAEESIRVKEEEIAWREMFLNENGETVSTLK